MKNSQHDIPVIVMLFVIGWVIVTGITKTPTASRWQAAAYPDGAFSVED